MPYRPGYEHPVDSVVDDLLACLDDPRLPLLQWSELYAVAQSRMPSDLAAQLEQIVGAAGVCSMALDRSTASCALSRTRGCPPELAAQLDQIVGEPGPAARARE